MNDAIVYLEDVTVSYEGFTALDRAKARLQRTAWRPRPENYKPPRSPSLTPGGELRLQQRPLLPLERRVDALRVRGAPLLDVLPDLV